MVNLCSKFEQDRSIRGWLRYWRLTTDFSSVLRDAPILPAIIWKTRGPISAKLGGDIDEQVIATHVVQNGEDIFSVSKAQQLKVDRWSAIRPKIAIFDPLQYCGRGRGEICESLIVAALMSEPLVYVWWEASPRLLCAVFWKKEGKKKLSSKT